jgi:hypothetical protein
MTH